MSTNNNKTFWGSIISVCTVAAIVAGIVFHLHNSAMFAINTQTEVIEEKLNNLGHRIERVELIKPERIAARIEAINDKIDFFIQELREHKSEPGHPGLHTLIAAIEQRLAAIESRLGKLEEK